MEAHGPQDPDLSIITVNYNTGDLLLGCLRAVYANTHAARVEYFVIDNASHPDGTLDRVRSEFPQVRMIENATNVGFAVGCNTAIAHAHGRYILLLNPDTAVRPHALDRMLQFMDTRPDIAVLGSPLVYGDGRDQGVAGRGFPTPLAFVFGRTTLVTRLFPYNRWSARFSSRRDPNRREPNEVDWVSGACMMVRREAVNQVGMLDPGYFMFWEDTDWCFRIKRAGWKVCCFHEANVVHFEGGSRNRSWRALWLATVGFHKSVYRYYRKHINTRAFDPTHLAVMGGLAVRALFVLAICSIERAARRTIKHSKNSGPATPAHHSFDSQALD